MTRQEKNDTCLLTSFLYGGNADYIEQLYSRFKTDPSSVDQTWASFFSRLDDTDGVAWLVVTRQRIFVLGVEQQGHLIADPEHEVWVDLG